MPKPFDDEAAGDGLLDGEPLLNLAALARLIPGRFPGKGPDPSTLYRWASGGYGRTGIVLRTQKVGRATCSKRSWLEEFLAAVEEAQRRPARPLPRPKGRRRYKGELDWARRVLDELGIGPKRAENKSAQQEGGRS